MPCWPNFRRPDFEPESIEEKEYEAWQDEMDELRAKAYGVYEEEEEENESENKDED